MSLTIGQPVQHSKFGLGVTMLVEGINTVILFESGPRVLVASYVTPIDATPESDALAASAPTPVPATMSAADAKPWIEAQVEKGKKRALRLTKAPRKRTPAVVVIPVES